MSLPRILSMRDDGSLAFAVAPEVDTLRVRCVELEAARGRVDLQGVPATRMELEVGFGDRDVELEVCRSSSGEERTVVRWEASSGVLSLDTTRSSESPEAWGDVASARLRLLPGEEVSLRVFVDGSVIEAYANERVAISGRLYPVQEVDTAIRVVVGNSAISWLRAYEMARVSR